MPRQRVVERIDVSLRLLALLLGVEGRLGEHVGQERIVDLHEEAGLDDGAVFGGERVGDREQIVLVAAVEVVLADAARRHRRQEGFDVPHSAERGLEIVEILAQRVFSAITHRTDAKHRRNRRHAAAHHGALEILLVIVRERRALGRKQRRALARARLETLQAFVDVDEKARLRHLAVGQHVEPAFGLAAHAVGHGLAHARVIGPRVVRGARQLRLHHVEQVVRPRQAADMGGENALAAAFHFCCPAACRPAMRPNTAPRSTEVAPA